MLANALLEKYSVDGGKPKVARTGIGRGTPWMATPANGSVPHNDPIRPMNEERDERQRRGKRHGP
jgi:hypothetical protein